jgi:hypothetical protein
VRPKEGVQILDLTQELDVNPEERPYRHALAPFASLLVREVLSATHFVVDLTQVGQDGTRGVSGRREEDRAATGCTGIRLDTAAQMMLLA